MTADRPPTRELTDEVLERIGLTRERWDAIQAELARREARAPNIGDAAPDFELPTLEDRESKVRLSDFRGKRPVGLIFGSYT